VSLYKLGKSALTSEWVRILQRAHRLGTSARRYLRRYGIIDEAEAVQRFAQMNPGKVICLILNWLTLNEHKPGNVEIRRKTNDAKMVCKTEIYVYKSSIRVRRVKRAPELIVKVLHKWDGQVS